MIKNLIQSADELPNERSLPIRVSLDCETNEQGIIEGMSFGYVKNNKSKGYYIPMRHKFPKGYEDYHNVVPKDVGKWLKSVVANKKRKFVFHSAEFDTDKFEMEWGIKFEDDRIDDTLLLHWMFDTERRHGLKGIMKDEYGFAVKTWKMAKGEGIETFFKYAKDDAVYTIFLYYKLMEQYRKHKKSLQKAYEHYREYEIPF